MSAETLPRVAGLAVQEIGTGPPVLALHGAYSTHAEIAGYLAPMLPERRLLIPDLPGMGDSAADGVASAADAVGRLDALVAATIGDERFVVVGHSYGGHLARGIAARRPDQVGGLALICPLVPDEHHPEPRRALVDDGAAAGLAADLVDGFTGYFVIQTETTAARYLRAVVPALGQFDPAGVERQLENDRLETAGYPGPVLVMTGRADSWVGWRQHAALLDAYPRASSLVVADAGHALPHEFPELMGATLRQWLRDIEGTPPEPAPRP